jgi:hypothetical protein
MQARESPPEQIVWRFRGIAYTVDLEKCRDALAERQRADEPDAIVSVAQAIEASEETVRRFFHGQRTSVDVRLKILDELGFGFHDVATPWEEPGTDTTSGSDTLGHAWRQVVAVRTSAQHFQARLRRTAPDLATLALVEASLARAATVMTAVLANLKLVEELFSSLPVPAALLRAVEPEAAVADGDPT